MMRSGGMRSAAHGIFVVVAGFLMEAATVVAPMFFSVSRFVSSNLVGTAFVAFALGPVYGGLFALGTNVLLYSLLARTFFPDPEDHWIFLLIMCTALVFGGFLAWFIGSFLLLRIWQGKALLVAIFLPLLFLLLVQE